jgi:hypothetical protein
LCWSLLEATQTVIQSRARNQQAPQVSVRDYAQQPLTLIEQEQNTVPRPVELHQGVFDASNCLNAEFVDVLQKDLRLTPSRWHANYCRILGHIGDHYRAGPDYGIRTDGESRQNDRTGTYERSIANPHGAAECRVGANV